MDGPPDAGLVPIDALEAVEGVPDGKAIVVGIHNGCLIWHHHLKTNKIRPLMQTHIQKPDSSDKIRKEIGFLHKINPIYFTFSFLNM